MSPPQSQFTPHRRLPVQSLRHAWFELFVVPPSFFNPGALSLCFVETVGSSRLGRKWPRQSRCLWRGTSMLPSTKWGVAQLHNLAAHLLHEQTCSSPPTPIRSNRPLIPPPAQVTGRRGRSPADTGFPPQPPHIRLPNLSFSTQQLEQLRAQQECGKSVDRDLGFLSCPPLSRTTQSIMGYRELGEPTALLC